MTSAERNVLIVVLLSGTGLLPWILDILGGSKLALVASIALVCLSFAILQLLRSRGRQWLYSIWGALLFAAATVLPWCVIQIGMFVMETVLHLDQPGNKLAFIFAAVGILIAFYLGMPIRKRLLSRP